MMRISELRHKDVIDEDNGKRLGYINDIEINVERGSVEAIILPGENRLFSLFSKGEETVLSWAQIKKIGVDVILIKKDRNEPIFPRESEDYTPAKRTLDDEFDYFSF